MELPKDPTYESLGYDQFLTRMLRPLDNQFQTSDHFNANVQDGSITNAKIKSLTADKIITGVLDATFIGGTLDSTMDVGTGAASSYVRLDGPNNRIVVHDGTNPRIAIGNV